jgi:ribosomal protein L32
MSYYAIKDFTTVACTVCGEFNLDHNLCFNCKNLLECLDCCGCEELEEGEGEE